MANKAAVVTGSSQGIGKAIALKLAREGYAVVINYRQGDQDQAEGVCREIIENGGEAVSCCADVSIPAQCDQLINKAVDEFGSIDVLVNNAGVNRDVLMLRMKDEEWSQIINNNLNSVFYCSRAALRPMMKKKYGRIINISSIVGIVGNAGQAHYSASKAGIIGLTMSMAKEYGNRGINVNAIAPGYIESNMTRQLPEVNRQRMLSSIAVGRLGQPEDVAGVAAFLASPEAAYITGQVIRVDGGLGGI